MIIDAALGILFSDFEDKIRKYDGRVFRKAEKECGYVDTLYGQSVPQLGFYRIRWNPSIEGWVFTPWKFQKGI